MFIEVTSDGYGIRCLIKVNNIERIEGRMIYFTNGDAIQVRESFDEIKRMLKGECDE